MFTPSIGRIVHFECDASTADLMMRRPDRGNTVQAGDLLPAVIVKVWTPNSVNLKVFADGPHDEWVTSVSLGTGPRTFREPARS